MIPRLSLQGSTVPRQMTLDFLHFVHQTPVHITPISPQANSRKEQVWEVFLAYDTVHWIPTTGSLQVQGLPQSTTPIPNSFNSWYKTVLSIQDLPYPGFSLYGFHFRCLWFRLDNQKCGLFSQVWPWKFMTCSAGFLGHFLWFPFIYIFIYVIYLNGTWWVVMFEIFQISYSS